MAHTTSQRGQPQAEDAARREDPVPTRTGSRWRGTRTPARTTRETASDVAHSQQDVGADDHLADVAAEEARDVGSQKVGA